MEKWFEGRMRMGGGRLKCKCDTKQQWGNGQGVRGMANGECGKWDCSVHVSREAE